MTKFSKKKFTARLVDYQKVTDHQVLSQDVLTIPDGQQVVFPDRGE